MARIVFTITSCDLSSSTNKMERLECQRYYDRMISISECNQVLLFIEPILLTEVVQKIVRTFFGKSLRQ